MTDATETARQRADTLIRALNAEGGGKVLHGALVAIIYAKANDIDAETRKTDAEIRQWERDSEL